MRGNTVYKRTYNQCLRLLAARPLGEWSGSEAELSETLDVSRTTVRAVLAGLAKAGLVTPQRGGRILRRHPDATDFFPEPQTESVAHRVERKFMQMVLHGDYQPGQMVNTSDLARQFGTSASAVREYLTQFSRFGLLERRENSGWIFKGITSDFAKEIYEIRELFELRSARRFMDLPDTTRAWKELETIEREHWALLEQIDEQYSDFSALDEKLHRLIHEASGNRFIQNFYDVISLIFHYHYQWDKSDEKERNVVAIHEHLDYIAALRSRDLRAVDAKCRVHLRTARLTLLRAIGIRPVVGGNGTGQAQPIIKPHHQRCTKT
ncbi:GntR family transcriptional regulator [Pseudoroseomonas globiformis]|uniref:GntR family transcriptional regulator n=1 Tax=Teichococcus globiformis TaxID=2307229 RepID=A0ABV7FYR0_9PROT